MNMEYDHSGMVSLDNFKSINRQAPAEVVSGRYEFIPTTRMVDEMWRHGWEPVQAFEKKQKGGEDNPRAGYGKHAIRFRHKELSPINISGDLNYLDILMTNSHDGTAAFNLKAAIFRFICSNGLVVSAGEFANISIRHVGHELTDRVMEATSSMQSNLMGVAGKIEHWSDIQMHKDDQEGFAKSALITRFGEEKANDLDPRWLLHARRREDRTDNLWTTFNVVQENIMKGWKWVEYQGWRRKSHTVRQIKGMESGIQLNEKLWNLAEGYARGRETALVC